MLAETIQASVRLPPELHEWLRVKAFTTRGSINQIIVDLVREAKEREETQSREGAPQ